MQHQFDACAAEALHEGRKPAVVVHVSVGEDQDIDIRQVHTQGAGIVKRPVFGESEIEESLAARAARRQADHRREPMFGQDAHPVAGGIFRSRPLNDGRAVMGGNVDEIVLQGEDLDLADFLELNGRCLLLKSFA